jgi:FkbM family methyltransferase
MLKLLESYSGLLRSLVIYYGIPLRGYRLTNFYSQFITKGDLCFDIGAHVGNHIRAFLKLGAKVVAVEPQPVMMHFLKFLYGRNRDLILLEAALGDRNGVEPLQVSSRTPTTSSLSTDWVNAVKKTESFSSVHWDQRIPVEVFTLNTLIEIYGQPTFCKLDVEGYEHVILKSLSIPIRAISFEYLPVARDSAIECVRHLVRLGNYQFNWTIGEARHFFHDYWVNHEEITIWLRNMRSNQRSGDVYARLA